MALQELSDCFVLGLATSLHCAGMCGPLAAGACGAAGDVATYQVARMVSYASVGALLGGMGSTMQGSLPLQSGWMSISVATLLILFVVGVHLPQPGFLRRAVTRLSARVFRAPGWSRGLLLGGITPLLPCGILTVVHTRAMLAGSAGEGALANLLFAVGSLPLLLLAQTKMALLRRWLSPKGQKWLMIGLYLSAAGMLLWRGIQDLSGQSCCAG